MKIDSFNRMSGLQRNLDLSRQKAPPKKNKGTVDQFVPGNRGQKSALTYSKKVVGPLKAQGEGVYESLRRLALELLKKQDYYTRRLQGEGTEPGGSDGAVRAEAAFLVADDGPLGAGAVSDRIVNFAIAACGGDRSRLELIKGAIEEGFRQVRGMLGGLPEVSLRTHDLIMEKLDRWAAAEE